MPFGTASEAAVFRRVELRITPQERHHRPGEQDAEQRHMQGGKDQSGGAGEPRRWEAGQPKQQARGQEARLLEERCG